jgi:hypothetical protein
MKITDIIARTKTEVSLKYFALALEQTEEEAMDKYLECVKRKKIPLEEMQKLTIFDVGLLSYLTAVEGTMSRKQAVREFLKVAGYDFSEKKVNAANVQGCRLITWRNEF